MVRAPVVVNVHALGGGQDLPAPFGVCVNMVCAIVAGCGHIGMDT